MRKPKQEFVEASRGFDHKGVKYRLYRTWASGTCVAEVVLFRGNEAMVCFHVAIRNKAISPLQHLANKLDSLVKQGLLGKALSNGKMDDFVTEMTVAVAKQQKIKR